MGPRWREDVHISCSSRQDSEMIRSRSVGFLVIDSCIFVILPVVHRSCPLGFEVTDSRAPHLEFPRNGTSAGVPFSRLLSSVAGNLLVGIPDLKRPWSGGCRQGISIVSAMPGRRRYPRGGRLLVRKGSWTRTGRSMKARRGRPLK